LSAVWSDYCIGLFNRLLIYIPLYIHLFMYAYNNRQIATEVTVSNSHYVTFGQ